MGYFDHIATMEEGNKLYRQLAKELHPDAGGDPEQFRAMRAEWQGLKLIEKHKPGWLHYRHTLTVTAQESRKRPQTDVSADRIERKGKRKKTQQERFDAAMRDVFREGGALVGELIGDWLTK